MTPSGVLDLVSKLGGRKAHFFTKLLVLLLHLTFTFSQVCRVVICEVVPTRNARQRTNHETDKSQLSS